MEAIILISSVAVTAIKHITAGHARFTQQIKIGTIADDAGNVRRSDQMLYDLFIFIDDDDVMIFGSQVFAQSTADLARHRQ